MVGLVVVSHSAALAEAALGLALEMVAGQPPRVVLAAGMDDGSFGTDAARVAAAIEEAEDGGGVVVITDLGSAVLSAEMAVEFLPDPDAPVRIVPAPFVEGLLAAVVAAAGGGDLAEVAAQASGALASKREQLGEVDPAPDGAGPGLEPGPPGAGAGQSAEGAGPGGAGPVDAASVGTEAGASADVVLVNPMGLHARPAATLAGALAGFDAEVSLEVPGRRPAPARSPLSVAGLGTRGGDTVRVSAGGPQAQAAVAEAVRLIEEGFGEAGEAPAAAQPDSAVSTGRPAGPGLGVSPGRVVGPAVHMPPPLAAPAEAAAVPPEARPAEARRLEAAASAVVRDLHDRARAAHGDAAAILSATAALAADPGPLEAALALLRDEGLDAERAIWSAYSDVAEQFGAAGGALAERASDVRDLRGRVVAALRGVPAPGVPERDAPFVLVARDLAPADTAGLDPARVLAIVASEGGPTSHTAILARSLGIPAVVGFPGAAALAEGEPVLVDGGSGEVVAGPSEEQSAGALTAPVPKERRAFTGSAATADGHAVSLLANIGTAADAAKAAAAGATGSGLFRTEFAFLDRAQAPSEDEQTELYAGVLRAFEGSKVVLRTLDSGSDKPLPFLDPEPEENPALGVRGLRTAFRHEGLLRTQLAAMARAQTLVPGTQAWVMAPMVATVEEAAWFAGLARAAGLATVGVMIETPAAALSAEHVLEHVDFVSLGTNDLAQYTMAADRLSAPLAALNDPWQPAVLRLIEATVNGAGLASARPGAARRTVGVCGEAASDPLLARVLIGLGVDSLSMSPGALAAVAEALAASTLEQCRAAATAALTATGAREARDAASGVL
ncbi:phosphoenolpyruvate--protein phosphotransferase [Galactobacter valiniphilus]|uniref:Phosphocarrier protein HPr n=1 Tax=Galactobacter valiniphilus TaxID=2676122 RepID=A0A399JGH4_9MICC|nr:phosphoenolpyruvate--protein phosphotransferase [Galactobacter valiniphilus]RII43242.1 phosphoenolpyruvate--protein phosphotransferase [Galactobacter valiniphilus]